MIKVAATSASRGEIMQLVDVFRARVVDVATDSLIVEITGTEDKIDGLLDVLRPYGVIEMVGPAACRCRAAGRQLKARATAAARSGTSDRRQRCFLLGLTHHGQHLLRRRRSPRSDPHAQSRHHRLRIAGARPRAEPARQRRHRQGRPAADQPLARARPRPTACPSSPSPRRRAGRTSSCC